MYLSLLQEVNLTRITLAKIHICASPQIRILALTLSLILKQSMRNHRFENNLVVLEFEKKYSKEESIILTRGFLSLNMDDKWDIVFERNELNLYRSWTGIGLYKLKVENVNNDELKVRAAFVDEKFLNNYSQQYCAELLNSIIEFVIFNRNMKSPVWDYSKNKL